MRSPSDLSAILSSQARFRVLKSLWAFGNGLSLRQLEQLTGLAIRSVQVAVKGLERERLMKADRTRTWRITPRHPAFRGLSRIFAVVSSEETRQRSESYGPRATAALRFSDEVRSLTRRRRPAP